MMLVLSIILGVSFVACLILTPLVRLWAARWGLVDRPDGRRKVQARPVPLAGGLAVLLSVAVALPLARLSPGLLRDGPLETASASGDGSVGTSDQTDQTDEAPHSTTYLWGLLLAVILICGVGLADDLGLLRGRHKLLGQLVAIAIVMSFGVLVQKIRLFEWELNLGLLAIPFTVSLLLGAINSLNLLDGMDGLLATVCLIILSALAVLAFRSGHGPAAAIAVALAGALLGFLRYNFPPASIFLGDSGSMLIGLVVGVLAIQSSLKGAATAALAAPLATLTIPILDTTAAILRRKLTGRSIYTTDRGHLHHCLLARGLSPRGVLFWIALFCLLTAAGALGSVMLKNESLAIVTSVAVVAILISVRIFGHGEFLLARRRFLDTALSLFRFRSGGHPHATAVHLQGSAGWNVLWGKFLDGSTELNLQSICLDVNAPAIHEGYHARWSLPGDESETPNLWFAEIPLMARGQVVGRLEIAGFRDIEPVWKKVAQVTELAEQIEVTLTDLLVPRGPPLAPASLDAKLPQRVAEVGPARAAF
jgi:UDP-GlcNAc:undecaprenyl-phosphate GlcNAc-1-phosphate transferase